MKSWLIFLCLLGTLCLQAQVEVLGERCLKHIFEGNIKSKHGKLYANGCHHKDALKPNGARIAPESSLKKGPKGVFKGKIEIFDSKSGQWVAKVSNKGYSTFFPEDWSREKTIKEIIRAYAKREKVQGGYNEYAGYASNGIEIRMYLNDKEEIISAFPKDWEK